eukprot:TRINITY_DN20678_c0_g1_i1.p1 TRINITY_DN20678_c0_g1~~TRINITY_DN20678_c0_g1_i1.p1  ORF type:complete len:589 (-),score=100.05 TRINITY_DN20678_c0_g1_i1:172-1938(-)
MSADQRIKGWVRSFRDTWGFVNSDSFPGDVFVGIKSNPHLESLSEQDIVEFEIKIGSNGKKEAVNVVVVSGQQQGGCGFFSNGEVPGEIPGDENLGGAVRYAGWVRSFKDTWGFIRSDTFAGDLFVGLKQNPRIQSLVVDDQVTFEIKTDATGKAQAVNVELANQPSFIAPANNGPAVRAQVGHLIGTQCTGKLKSFKDGWGFVNSDMFGGDLFLHTRTNPSLGEVHAGDTIQFEVAEDPKAPSNYNAVNAIVVKDTVHNLVGEVLRGNVKSFKDGWGFLNSSRFMEDLFIGGKGNPQLKGSMLLPGEPVEFQVARDEKGNGFQAVRVKRLCDPTSGMTRNMGMGMMMPIGANFGMGQFGPVFAGANFGGCMGMQGGNVIGGRPMNTNFGGNAQGTASAMIGRTCTGQIRSYREQFGFAISPLFQGDIFVGARSNPHWVTPPQTGDQIKFTVQQNGAKVEAVDVEVIGSSGQPAMNGCGQGSFGARDRSRSPRKTQRTVIGAIPGRPSQTANVPRDPSTMIGLTVPGFVRSFRGTWGFVNSTAFDGDLFVGTNTNRQLPRPLQQGDSVQFTVSAGQNGKPEAVNVQLM